LLFSDPFTNKNRVSQFIPLTGGAKTRIGRLHSTIQRGGTVSSNEEIVQGWTILRKVGLRNKH
jgi:hypothetical protein